MPDDDQDGPPDGDDRTVLAATSGDASVAFAQEGVGPPGDDGRLAEDAGQVAVAVPGGAAAFGFASRGTDAGRELRPRAQVPCGRESRHVHPDLGDDDGGGDRPDAGDFIQAGRRHGERGQVGLDLGVDGGDVGVDTVDTVQHPGQQESVMLVEVAVERLLEPTDLGAHPGARQLRERLGVAFPGDQRGHHRPPGDPEDIGGDHGELDARVFEEFLDPVLLRGAHTDQIDAVAGQIPQPADRPRRHETGPQHLPFGDFAQPDRVEHVGLGPPW